MAARAYSSRTVGIHVLARRSFEKAIGKPAAVATTQDVITWLQILRAAGRPISTCRTYLSAINHLAGLQITPSGRRTKTQ